MPELTAATLEEYLTALFGRPVSAVRFRRHDAEELGGELKGFGYGAPVFIECSVGNERKKLVLETMSPAPFGHDHFSDRAQAVLWEHSCFSKLPRHVRSLDSGAFLRSGKLISTGAAEEFFLITEFVEGDGYFRDLDRIGERGAATNLDHERIQALSDYLALIHRTKIDSPELYTRRIRDLLGHGECILGIIDNYPAAAGFIGREQFMEIEHLCVDWRWRIKNRAHRLSQVHGDFHPWNILFREGADFTVLDRSRGEWGEPADDVTCLTTNLLFASLIRYGKLEGPFRALFEHFWDNYLVKTGDREMLDLAAPFYAWRGLVVASPVWYPHLPAGVRESLVAFIRNVLHDERFDFTNVNRYLP